MSTATKTLNRSYWIATIIFALWLTADGMAGIMKAQAGVDSLLHLGYPLYLLTITGIAKVLGAVAILQTKWTTIKEWTFAGYAISCFGALASRIAVRDSFFLIVLPVIFLLIMFIPYVLWKKRVRMV